jgi:hypothetical protein
MELSGVQGGGFLSSIIESSLGEECSFLSTTLEISGAKQSVFWMQSLTLLYEGGCLSNTNNEISV